MKPEGRGILSNLIADYLRDNPDKSISDPIYKLLLWAIKPTQTKAQNTRRSP